MTTIAAGLAVAMPGFSLASDFDEGNRLYREGRFSEAKQRYESAIDRGHWSASTFYNLGNAMYRLGAPGPAILNYERTLALAPGHPEAAANIAVLREQTGARIAAPTWLDGVFPSFSTNAFIILATISAWSAIYSLMALISGIRWRGTATLLLVAALLVTAYCSAAAWHAERSAALAVITARNAEARLEPADRSGLAESLPAGSRVRVLSEHGEWIYCELPGGGRGWITAAAVEKVRLPSA